ncbi:MAG: hypothetical protein EZS28_011840 [Streblomastix strix]|uniref:PLAC8 family protein n=1 Tax=Streblomastix strix TaxID=222440 RepID=A0A5J4WDP1_9EUKA|nr:MAG: hypothetical protein EZS28_011840 [Streblomastix strix]
MDQRWSSNIFGCFGDCKICFAACIFQPCVLGSMLADLYGEKFGYEHCCLSWCCPCAPLLTRVGIRQREGIPGTLCEDYIMSCCCLPCSICQTAKQFSESGCKFHPIDL